MANVLIGCVCVFKPYVYLSGTMEEYDESLQQEHEKKIEMYRVFFEGRTRGWCYSDPPLLHLSPSRKLAQFHYSLFTFSA